MGKIILFYKYVDIQYPKRIEKWQQNLCSKLNLKGRVILAHEGINATLGGKTEDINTYISEMLNHELFSGIDFKESPGSSEDFPKLRIIIKDEIVNLRQDTKKINVSNTAKHLTPEQTHELLNNKPEDLIILDARNNYESKVGMFRDAVTPDIKNFRDFPEYIDNNIALFKDKTVLMYCTGGIRCERASAYLKTKDTAKEIYQIEGGIHRYIEKYPDGHFRGKNYVFDSRVTVEANKDILGVCYVCNISCDDYANCLNAQCNRHFIGCLNCITQLSNTCSKNCYDLITEKKVKPRPPFKKSTISLNF